MKLWHDYQYLIKRRGESSYKLEYGEYLKMKDVIYVPGLKNNLLSISTLDERKLGFLLLMAKFLCGLKEDNIRCNSDWRRIRRLVQAKGTA